ncbi:hypothetical protein C5B42_02065, partial [Candidatus Cerribacteria bacterium 'Amazon FNV 2010 28 9']
MKKNIEFPPISIWNFILLFFFGLVSLGQLERIELSGGRALYLHEVVMGIILLYSFFTSTRWICSLWSSIRGKLAILFNLFVLVTLTFQSSTVHSFVSSLLYLVRLDVYLLFGTFLFSLILRKVLSGKALYWLIIGSIVLIALFGLAQYVFIPDTRLLVYLGWDNHYLRLISTIFDPGFAGAILCVGALLLQFQLFKKKLFSTQLSYFLSLISYLCIIAALLLTYSRASYVAFAAGCLLLLFTQKQWKHLVVLILFIISIFFLPRLASEGTRLERTASIAARLQTDQQGLNQHSLQEVFIGQGWYATKKDDTQYSINTFVPNHASGPENTYIFFYTET